MGVEENDNNNHQTFLQYLVLKQAEAVTDRLVDAMKRGETRVIIDDTVYDNLKSKDEAIAMLEEWKTQSANPLYNGPNSDTIDAMLIKLNE